MAETVVVSVIIVAGIIMPILTGVSLTADMIVSTFASAMDGDRAETASLLTAVKLAKNSNINKILQKHSVMKK